MILYDSVQKLSSYTKQNKKKNKALMLTIGQLVENIRTRTQKMNIYSL